MQIELLPGEEICPDCEGLGRKSEHQNALSLDFICFRCWGTGKVDWVTRAMGLRKISPYDSIQIPLIRHHYPKLIAEELISVQPMPKPEIWEGFKKDEN